MSRSQLTLWTMTLLLLLSPRSTAQVLTPNESFPCTGNCPVTKDWNNWFLIKNATLKSLYSDAEAVPILKSSLLNAQQLLDERTATNNLLMKTNYDLVVKLRTAEQDVYDLENPPWYRNPLVTGLIGTGVGASVVAILVVVIKLSV